MLALDCSSFSALFGWKSKLTFPAVGLVFDLFAFLGGIPGVLEVLDIFGPHFLFSDGLVVVDDSVELFFDRVHISNFLLAERPDGHVQEIVKVPVFLVILFLPIFGRLNSIEILVFIEVALSQLSNPFLFGLDELELPINDFLDEPGLVGDNSAFFLELADEVSFPLGISFDPLEVKLVNNLLNSFVFVHLPEGVEEMHIVHLGI